jgi:branched-chain amino acid transport system permease protein
MLSAAILIPAVLNGLLMGAVYALVALGLTLIYGVLHIINFAHGALLTAAMFAAFFAHRLLGLDPYIAAIGLTPLFYLLGYALQRFVIGPAAHGEDRNILLVTLGLAVVIENALLTFFVPIRAPSTCPTPSTSSRWAPPFSPFRASLHLPR